jgi:hypothetical protein
VRVIRSLMGTDPSRLESEVDRTHPDVADAVGCSASTAWLRVPRRYRGRGAPGGKVLADPGRAPSSIPPSPIMARRPSFDG